MALTSEAIGPILATVKKRSSLSWPRLRALGVEAEADPRTIDKILAGERVHGEAVVKRVQGVLIRHGLLNPDGSPKPPASPGVGEGGA